MKPNHEQQAIIDAFLSRDGSIAVNALAGTGKTTTLKMLAEAAPGQRMQYLAFNRSIADDARAKMPRNVEVGTMHSLAYRAMQPDRSRLEMRLNGGYVAQRLSLTSVTVRLDFGDFLLTPAQQGAAIIATVAKYCNSGDLDLTIKHVASWQTVFEECPRALDQDQGLKQIIFRGAEKLWSDMRSRNSDCPITHDTYLKLWALAMGQIRSDVLFFDEAQDASGVFLQILSNQQGRRIVYVGDKNQQIYAWRGAVDALDRIKSDQRLYLTRSYRFGQGIADQANRMLTCLGEHHLLVGEGPGSSKDGSRAVLTRTNARAISRFCDSPDAQLVGAKEFLSTVKALDALREGRGSTGAFALFPTYKDLMDYVATPDGSDLRPLIDLVDRLGIDEVMCRLEHAAMSSTRRSSLTITTAHKSKGREWDHVEIENDWRMPKAEARQDEMRLMYVALTRGRCRVDASKVESWLNACERLVCQDGEIVLGIEDDDGDKKVADLAMAVIESAKARAAAAPASADAGTEVVAPAKPRKRRGRKARGEA